MVADTALVIRKLRALRTHREELREYSSITLDAYRSDWKVQRIVERTLQMMVEICADVASHLVSASDLRVGTSVADAFRSLGEAAILPPELTPRMTAMAGFRNILVHQYEAVDPAVVVTVLRRYLDDFMAFDAAIRAYLGTSSS